MTDSQSVPYAAEEPTYSSSDVRSYQMCTRTVMDTTDPEISFDAEGVSNHWHEYVRARERDALTPERAQAALERIVSDVKQSGRGKPYDCVLGLSGGVDSSYLAHVAVELGLRPLIVHFDNGWNSELAVGNI